jgi:hypothetical protein
MSISDTALMAYHELLDHSVPVLILDDETIIEGTINIKNELERYSHG